MSLVSHKKPTPTSILCELTRLKSQQNFLEKTQTVKIQNLDVDANYQEHDEKCLLLEIEKLHDSFKTEFPMTRIEAKNKITDLFENITNFETHMMSTDCLKNVHVITYREEVIKMNNTLSDYSKSTALQNELLKAIYKDIESALPSAEILLKDIPKHTIKKHKTIQEAIKNPISAFACAEVKEFDKYLLTCGGYTGSWKEEEHNIYIKFKNKFKSNIDRIIECVNLVLPGKIILLVIIVYYIKTINMYICNNNICKYFFRLNFRRAVKNQNTYYNNYMFIILQI